MNWNEASEGRAAARRTGAALARLAACVLAMAIGHAAAAEAAPVVPTVSLSPQGEAAKVRQVVAKFSVPMRRNRGEWYVASDDPVVVHCTHVAQARIGGRWDSDREWLVDIDGGLPPGERCTVAVQGAPISEAGVPLAPTAPVSFTTGGPKIEEIVPSPVAGRTIAESQVFVALLNGAASRESLLGAVRCELAPADGGASRRLPIRLVEGSVRDRLLEVYRLTPHADRVVTFACADPMPAGAALRLVWGAGVATRDGVASAADSVLDYRVHGDLVVTAEPYCGTDYEMRSRRDGDRCDEAAGRIDTLGSVRVAFSSPLTQEQALRVALGVARQGTVARRKPTFSGMETIPSAWGGNLVTALYFIGPYEPGDRLDVDVPADLVDAGGRPLAKVVDHAAVEVAQARVAPDYELRPHGFGVLGAKDAPALELRRHAAAREQDLLRWRVPVDVPAGRGFDDLALMRWLARGFAYVDDGRARVGVVRADLGDAALRGVRLLPSAAGADPDDAIVDTLSLDLLDGLPGVVHTRLRAGDSAQRFDGPGLYVVEAPMAPGPGEAGPAARRRSEVLVTDLAVHFLRGGGHSLVWVTSLSAAKAVPGAWVQVSDCTGARLFEGRTDADGLLRIDGELPARDDAACRQALPEPHAGGEVFVSARRAAGATTDVAFTWSDWSIGFPRFVDRVATLAPAPTFVDRTLLAPGQAVSMKHHLRRDATDGRLPARERWPDTLVVVDPAGREYPQPLAWRERGVAESHWRAPAGAPVGKYEVLLARGPEREPVARFEVHEFRIPEIDAGLGAVAPPWQAGAQVRFGVEARYVNGGVAAGLPVSIDAWVHPARADEMGIDPLRGTQPGLRFDDLPDESTVAIPEWVAPQQFSIVDDDRFDEAFGRSDPQLLAHRSAILDANGKADVDLGATSLSDRAQLIETQLRFADPDGEVRSIENKSIAWPSARRLGLSLTRREAGAPLDLVAVVLDLSGHPVAGARIAFDLSAVTREWRAQSLAPGQEAQRLAESTRVVALPPACAQPTAADGQVRCSLATSEDEAVTVLASTLDPAGRAARARALAGGRWYLPAGNPATRLFGGARPPVDEERNPRQRPPELRLDAASYRAGDTVHATLLGRFDHVDALATVSGDGVLRARRVVLDGLDPVIAWPVERGWLPRVQVQVLAVDGHASLDAGQGRRRAPDLAAPLARLGEASARISLDERRLAVAVVPERPALQPGETGRLRVRVTRVDGGAAPAGTEIAVAVVDDALQKLLPNDTAKVLESLVGEGDEASWASMQGRPSALGRLVAFLPRSRLAADGVARVEVTGSALPRPPFVAKLRTVFDTALLWRAHVALDERGEALVEVPTNDSLAHWRVVVVADAAPPGAPALAGTGEAFFDTRQPLAISVGLPRVVRGGDRYDALVTVRNASEERREVVLQANAGALALEARRVVLEAGARADVSWPVAAPADAGALAWEFRADSGPGAGDLHDRVAFTQAVLDPLPVTVRRATLAQADPRVELSLAPPPQAATDAAGRARGGVEIAVTPTLGGGLPGVAGFFRAYPYRCLEQQVSLAVGQGDAAAWAKIVEAMPDYVDDDGLLAFFPVARDPGLVLHRASAWRPPGSEALTAYVLAISAQAQGAGGGFALPASLRNRLVAALSGVADGTLSHDAGNDATSTALVGERTLHRLEAAEALSRVGAAPAGVLDELWTSASTWPVAALIDARLVLAREPASAAREARIAEVDRLLQARIDRRDARLGIAADDARDAGWMFVGGDVDAVRLALLAAEAPEWADLAPRLMQGALGLQSGGHWSTTVANAWGVLATKAFSARFEAAATTGRTTAAFAGEPASAIDWSATAGGGTLSLAWPRAAGASGTRMTVAHDGAGRPWVSVLEKAAVPVSKPAGNGFAVRKTVTPTQVRTPGQLSRGDVLRVHLEIDAKADAAWVAVDDPIPAGATLLGSGLGDDRERRDASSHFGSALAYEEQRADRYVAYFSRLDGGRTEIDYAVRVDAPGRFVLPATRVEAMYVPSLFAEWPNEAWTVAP